MEIGKERFPVCEYTKERVENRYVKLYLSSNTKSLFQCSSCDTVQHPRHLQSPSCSTNNLRNNFATNLVDVVFLYGEVKHGVEIVEEVHHFHRGTLRGQTGKANYVREVDGHRLEHLGLDYFAFLQLVGYNASFTVNERNEKRIVS